VALLDLLDSEMSKPAYTAYFRFRGLTLPRSAHASLQGAFVVALLTHVSSRHMSLYPCVAVCSIVHASQQGDSVVALLGVLGASWHACPGCE
jgi:hypothetical protein